MTECLQDLDVFALPLHPANEAWPMMTDLELQRLAHSIKKVGLLYPIAIKIIDGEAFLVDGKCRREACRMIGVTPAVRDIGDQNPIRYVIDMNNLREHLPPGRQAMKSAMISPEPREDEFPDPLVDKARVVLRSGRGGGTLAENVMHGSMQLDEAYDQVRELERIRERDAALIANLDKHHPSLATKVRAGELTLVDAAAEAMRQIDADESRRKAMFKAIADTTKTASKFADDTYAADARALFTNPYGRDELFRQLRRRHELLRDGGGMDSLITKVETAFGQVISLLELVERSRAREEPS